jgi:hypothetical protein
MSHTPNFDAKIKTILDATKSGERVCALTGEKWEMTEEEISWYKKFNVPPSKYSPLSRLRHLTSFFVGGQWWNNKHPETGKPLISPVHPATHFQVLPDKEWFEKDFQTTQSEYHKDIAFFDQLYSLRLLIPTSASRDYEPAVNSLSVASFGDENSYFMIASKAKNSFFGVVALQTENSSEVYNSNYITDSYFIVHSERIHQGRFIQESRDCLSSAFLFDCRNCEYCFGATNKRHRKYLWWNEQLSKEEWEKRYVGVNLRSRKKVELYKQQFDELIRQAVWPENFNDKTQDCLGEYLTNCVDCRYVYYGDGGARNNYWVAWAIGKSEDNAFSADPSHSQQCYLCSAAQRCYQCLYSPWISRCQNVEYCTDCYDCEYCFGCVGLRRKTFCVFNKPYSEGEYWKLVDRIKVQMLEQGEYGEFFPAKFSAGYFPETGAVRYYLADNSFGEKIGAHLFDPASCGAIGEDLMNAREVRSILEIPDTAEDLSGWAGIPIYDPVFDRRFSFLALEIAFYQKNYIAPPNEHHIKRVKNLISRANSGVFENTTCDQCHKEVFVSKNESFPKRIIYCKKCYLNYLEKNG